MDFGRLVVLAICVAQFLLVVSGNMLFKVEHKYKGKPRSLSAFKAHDDRRRGRMLDAADFSLGGNGNPTDSGLYFTKIRLGNPSNDFHVQVDTGSDILWVNCAGCDNCPIQSDIGIDLSFYDPKSSNTAEEVACDSDQCSMIYSGSLSMCKPKTPCYYEVTYGDGSSTTGYFVEDVIHYDKVSGNLKTTLGNGTVVFGCGAKQGGQLSSTGEALDGIIGFGQANSSVLSQLSTAKKVKKIFSHCLDGKHGGGIFAIGEVAEPKLSTTPLVAEQAHYTISLESVEVGKSTMDADMHAIIDSGSTLAYLPSKIYEPLMRAITTAQPNLKVKMVQDQYPCFEYDDDLDEAFPAVKFHFKESLTFNTYPHEYLFELREDVWCIGWQNSQGQSKDGKDIVLLGDLVLSNKLVMYDLEKEGIGWKEYNCSSSIKVKESTSGKVYSLGAHDISSACLSTPCSNLTFLLVILTVILFRINHHKFY